MTVVNIQLFTKFFFCNTTNHTRIIFSLPHSLPLFIGHAITQLQFFCFAVACTCGCGTLTSVFLMTGLTPCTQVMLVRPTIKELIKLSFIFFSFAQTARFSHGTNRPAVYILSLTTVLCVPTIALLQCPAQPVP